MDIFILDDQALLQPNFNVDLYVIILIYNNLYYGHIYTWVSPVDPSYCLFIGIRNRIDSIFIKQLPISLANVSSYLIEAVRLFALSKGCTQMVVVYPEPIMQQILPTLGFKASNVPIYYFGRSILTSFTINPPSSFTCFDCLNYTNLTHKITNVNFNFHLYN